MQRFKEVYHEILIGDYIEVSHVYGGDVFSGYVYRMSIGGLGLQLSIINFEDSYIKTFCGIIHKESEDKVSLRFLNINLIKRNILWSSKYICYNLCKDLKEFPDACSVCPINKTVDCYFLCDTVITKNTTGYINKISFLDMSMETEGFESKNYEIVSSYLVKYFSEFQLDSDKDFSIKDIIDIFENPQHYKENIISKIYYYTSSLPSFSYTYVDLRFYNPISQATFGIPKKQYPCSICIYNLNCSNNCNLKTLKMI